MSNVYNFLKNCWKHFIHFSQSKAVNTLEWEVSELEHIFALLTFSTFIGLPAPPMQITLDLLPALEPELALLLSKIDTAQAPLSNLFSVLDIG